MASPSSQVVPFQPAVQVHVLGAVHTPPFWQGEEQMAAEDMGTEDCYKLPCQQKEG